VVIKPKTAVIYRGIWFITLAQVIPLARWRFWNSMSKLDYSCVMSADPTVPMNEKNLLTGLRLSWFAAPAR